MKVLTYNKQTNERTIAQSHAIELKKAGYTVTKLVDEQENLVAFGYNPKGSPIVTHFIDGVNYGDYEFIYWN